MTAFHCATMEERTMLTNSTIRMRAALAVAALVLAACGGGGSSGYNGVTAPPGDGHPAAAPPSLPFPPPSLPAHVGEIVKFSFGSVGHNFFFDAQAGPPADIGGTNANVTTSRTFATAG